MAAVQRELMRFGLDVSPRECLGPHWAALQTGQLHGGDPKGAKAAKEVCAGAYDGATEGELPKYLHLAGHSL